MINPPNDWKAGINYQEGKFTLLLHNDQRQWFQMSVSGIYPEDFDKALAKFEAKLARADKVEDEAIKSQNWKTEAIPGQHTVIL